MEQAMRSTPSQIAFYIFVFVVVLVLLALPIWLGLGPVVHSQTGLMAGIGISCIPRTALLASGSQIAMVSASGFQRSSSFLSRLAAPSLVGQSRL
jgi:hypothetical protein